MKTPKLLKGIAKKFKNWKTTTSKENATQEPKISSREEANKLLEITIEHQPTVVTAKATTAKDENSKEVHEVCKYIRLLSKFMKGAQNCELQQSN